MSANNKTLCLFTTEFPFGKQVETFIESELEVMDEVFDKVYIFPSISDSKYVRKVPKNFEVIILDHNWGQKGNKLFFDNFFLVLKILFLEFIHSPEKKIFIKSARKFKNILLHKLYLFGQLQSFIEKRNITNAFYYSYWLNDWTITLGLMKQKKLIKKFISRAHGFDIYEERYSGKIIPMRYFQLKMVDKVYSVSKKGYEYLKKKKIFPEKITFSYLGVSDKGVNPFDENEKFRLVSCSNLMPLKRVHLIIEILKKVNFPIQWVHFGDGDGNLLNDFKKMAETLPPNIQYEFKGHVPNTEVFEYYRSNSVNLFILLSESEGLPMSLIEACSFGIPLLATDVGGVGEIVNSNTGILVNADVDTSLVAQKICDFQKSRLNTLEFRNGVKKFWTDNFLDTANYKKFYTSFITG
jgi:glycosyltransferase involved in cell wall biosynthesis